MVGSMAEASARILVVERNRRQEGWTSAVPRRKLRVKKDEMFAILLGTLEGQALPQLADSTFEPLSGHEGHKISYKRSTVANKGRFLRRE